MPYTMATYASEIMQRLHRYDVSKSVDMSMLEASINQARFDVQMATLQAVPERYSRIHRPTATPTVSWTDSARMFEHDTNTGGARVLVNQVCVLPLPEDFITDVSVAIEVEDNLWEARCVSKRDLHTVLTKSFSKPTPRNPIYCIEKFVGSTQSRLLISIGDALLETNKTEIWYLAKLPWLQIENSTGGSDPEIRIGYDLGELVVLVASMKILIAIGMPQASPLLRQDIDMMIQALQRQFEGGIDRSRLLVQARESNVPNVPIADANANAMRI